MVFLVHGQSYQTAVAVTCVASTLNSEVKSFSAFRSSFSKFFFLCSPQFSNHSTANALVIFKDITHSRSLSHELPTLMTRFALINNHKEKSDMERLLFNWTCKILIDRDFSVMRELLSVEKTINC